MVCNKGGNLSNQLKNDVSLESESAKHDLILEKVDLHQRLHSKIQSGLNNKGSPKSLFSVINHHIYELLQPFQQYQAWVRYGYRFVKNVDSHLKKYEISFSKSFIQLKIKANQQFDHYVIFFKKQEIRHNNQQMNSKEHDKFLKYLISLMKESDEFDKKPFFEERK